MPIQIEVGLVCQVDVAPVLPDSGCFFLESISQHPNQTCVPGLARKAAGSQIIVKELSRSGHTRSRPTNFDRFRCYSRSKWILEWCLSLSTRHSRALRFQNLTYYDNSKVAHRNTISICHSHKFVFETQRAHGPKEGAPAPWPLDVSFPSKFVEEHCEIMFGIIF